MIAPPQKEGGCNPCVTGEGRLEREVRGELARRGTHESLTPEYRNGRPENYDGHGVVAKGWVVLNGKPPRIPFVSKGGRVGGYDYGGGGWGPGVGITVKNRGVINSIQFTPPPGGGERA